MTMKAVPQSEATNAASLLRCIACGAQVNTATGSLRCPHCFDLLEVFYPQWKTRGAPNQEVCRRAWKDRKSSNQPQDRSGVWRFREFLPIVRDFRSVVTLGEGNTQVFELPRCQRSVGVGKLLAKHQGMNPTGSFKDTGMTAAVSVAKELGYEWVACASTGNTSASMAAYAARAGLKSLVLIPEGKIAWGKLSQSLDYGALTCQLKTDFDGCLRILNEIVSRLPIYLLNSSNPYRLEGQKTCALELLEQLDWQVPDHVIVPGGNLANSSAIGKMFLELKELGFIGRLPKISIIQAEGANPLYRTINENDGQQLVPVVAETHATAIRIGAPVSWKKALSVLRMTGGWCEQVSEAQIAAAKSDIGAEGVGCEPASAVTLAGLKKLVKQDRITDSDTVVLILTGHVLKDAEYTLNFHRGELFENEPELAGLRRPPVVLDADTEKICEFLARQRNSEKEQ